MYIYIYIYFIYMYIYKNTYTSILKQKVGKNLSVCVLNLLT